MNSVSDSVFPTQLFSASGPLQFKQGNWLGQNEFLDKLQSSWIAQYSDYLGVSVATELVNQLQESGDLYAHDERYTLEAWMHNEIVGIASIRQLEGLSLITMLEVVKSHQGQGVGCALLKVLETVSPRLLAHVSIHRPTLKSFYVRRGFVELQPAVIEHYGHELSFDVLVRSSLSE